MMDDGSARLDFSVGSHENLNCSSSSSGGGSRRRRRDGGGVDENQDVPLATSSAVSDALAMYGSAVASVNQNGEKRRPLADLQTLSHSDERRHSNAHQRQKRHVYRISVLTGDVEFGGTQGAVYMTLYGDQRQTEELELAPAQRGSFARGEVDIFTLELEYLGNVGKVKMRHDGHGVYDAWKLERVMVEDTTLNRTWCFFCSTWLNVETRNEAVLRPKGGVGLGRGVARRRSSIMFGADFKLPCAVLMEEDIGSTNPEQGNTDEPSSVQFVRQRVRIQFQIQFFTKEDVCMYVSGSSPELGAFDPTKALRMFRVEEQTRGWRGQWQLEVEIDRIPVSDANPTPRLEYKFFTVDELTKRICWNAGEARFLEIPSSSPGKTEPISSLIDAKPMLVTDVWRATPMRHDSLRRNRIMNSASRGLDNESVSQLSAMRGASLTAAPSGSDFLVTPTPPTRHQPLHLDDCRTESETGFQSHTKAKASPFQTPAQPLRLEMAMRHQESTVHQTDHLLQAVQTQKLIENTEKLEKALVVTRALVKEREMRMSELDEQVAGLKRSNERERGELETELWIKRDEVAAAMVRIREVEEQLVHAHAQLEQSGAFVEHLQSQLITKPSLREIGVCTEEQGMLLSQPRAKCHVGIDPLVMSDSAKPDQPVSSVQQQQQQQSEMLHAKVELLHKQLHAFRDIHHELQTVFDENRRLIAQYQQVGESLCEMTAERNALKLDLGHAHERWKREHTERRRIFNELQNLRGNIRVFCRVRPIKESEGVNCVRIYSPDGVSAASNNSGSSLAHPDLSEQTQILLNGKSFEFDRVFGPQDGQETVYRATSDLVTSVLDGYNVCIFAYGQTGSGKTHTMSGTGDERGVNYRALDELFARSEERDKVFDTSIKVSMLEIYNEHLRDLISDPDGNFSANANKVDLKLGSDGVYAANLTWLDVYSVEQVWDIMNGAAQNRSSAKTAMNERSSRSHLILSVEVESINRVSGARTTGKLNMVDLAGSERVSRSQASGERLKEAQHINKSLSALADVFSALVNKAQHVPFRNSKLTFLLQDSLSGDSKTLMFVNVSPAEQDSSESVSSLMLASRVSKVELGKASKRSSSAVHDAAELVKATKLLNDAQGEIQAAKAREKTLSERHAKLTEACSALQLRVEDAEREKEKFRQEMLQAKDCATDERARLEEELDQVRERHNKDLQELVVLRTRVEDLEKNTTSREHQHQARSTPDTLLEVVVLELQEKNRQLRVDLELARSRTTTSQFAVMIPAAAGAQQPQPQQQTQPQQTQPQLLRRLMPLSDRTNEAVIHSSAQPMKERRTVHFAPDAEADREKEKVQAASSGVSRYQANTSTSTRRQSLSAVAPHGAKRIMHSGASVSGYRGLSAGHSASLGPDDAASGRHSRKTPGATSIVSMKPARRVARQPR
ncbi:Kinesin-like protein KIN-14S [Porphyridium purpureum]|uniref:Kinesin-like protein KIN-14S n=1 Tax=Porphyridium purpureum TaxID=35688 RepID=A0A5J4YQ18_PORPP|nr:Kinesin-like protein KIN-14S [Porphyridium purpureum]|eukprot:POR4149..scf222_8